MYHCCVTTKERVNQNPKVVILLEIFCGVLFGLAIAALLNRVVNYFFLCVFVGAFASGVLTLFFEHRKKKAHFVSKKEMILVNINSALIVSLATVISFAFLAILPLNVDRSFSVWTLNQMDRLEKPQSRNELILEGAEFFSPSYGEISRRIDEQIRLKNIEETGGKLQLSERGKMQVKFHRALQKIFGLNIKYTRS